MENKFFRFKRLKAQTLLFAPVVFLLIALISAVFLKQNTPFVQQTRIVLTEIATPVIRCFNVPIHWVKDITEKIGHIVLVYQENEKLRSANIRLQAWRNTAEQLAFENKELKKLLNYVPVRPISFITAPVLADASGDFSRSKIIGAGYKDGVKRGDVVFTEKSLVGRIIEAGPRFSRLLMLTDYFSRVPVMIPEKGIKGILTGDNTPFPKLILLPEGADIHVGDRLVTSGDSGVYPSGLPIGSILSLDNDVVSVRLNQPDISFEFVRVVYYGLDDTLLVPFSNEKDD